MAFLIACSSRAEQFAAEVRALADLCVAIFNTNEFVYIP